MAVDVDTLQIQIEAESANASENLGDLVSCLERMKTAVPGSGRGLKTLSERLTVLSNAMQGLADGDRLGGFASVLNNLQGLNGANIPKSLPERLSSLGVAMNSITPEAISNLDSMTNSLQRLSGVDLSGLPAAIHALKDTASANVDSGGGTGPKPTQNEEIGSVNDTPEKVTILQRAFAMLRNAASAAWGEVKKFGSGIAALSSSALQKFSSGLKSVGSYMVSKFTKPFKNAIGTISKWKNAFGRIAFYRTVRAAIAAITSGVKEGIENLYQYSRLVGTDFAPAMNSLATSAQYLKNSLGAMGAPLIQAVAPAVDFLVDKFVSLLNVIGKVFAALSGKSTYTQAVKVAKEYADATNEAANAAKGFLLGIDELNVLDNSSGSGSVATDYGSMFEETEVPIETMDWAAQIKKAIEDGDWHSVGAILAEKLNNIIDGWDPYAWGANLGEKINNGLSAVFGFMTTFDFEDLGAKAATSLNSLLGSVDWNLLGQTLAEKWNALIDLIYGFVTTFNWEEFGRSISEAICGWFDKVDWTKAEKTLSEGAKGIFSAVTELLKGMPDEIEAVIAMLAFGEISSKLISAGTTIGKLFGRGILGGAVGGVIAGIATFGVSLYDAIVNGLDWLNAALISVGATAAGAGIGAIIGMLGGPIGAGIGALIGLAVGLITDGTVLLVQNWDSVVAWFNNACSTVAQFFADLWQDIVDIWDVCSGWFDANVIQPVVGFFTGLWADISSLASECWAAIIDFFTPAVEWFSNLFGGIWQTVSDVFYNIGVIATDCWEAIKTVWGAVSGWFDQHIVQPVAGFFSDLWEGIYTAASNCWAAIVGFFTPAVEWFSNLLNSVWQTWNSIFHNIAVIASGCWESIKAVWAAVPSWFNTTIIQPVSKFFSNMWTLVKTMALAAWDGIKSRFAAIAGWISTNIIQPVSTFFANLWTNVKVWAINAWGGIKAAFSTIGGWINSSIIQPVSAFFKNLWDGFLSGAKAAWEGAKSVFGAAANFFGDIFSKAWAAVVKVFSVAGNIFVDIKDGIVEAFKSVVNGLIKGINSVVAIPFNGINSALKMVKEINIMGLTPFSGLKTISVPQIPFLAGGGMVSAGQMFIAREAGPELVGSIGNRTAVANNDQIVAAVSRGVYSAVRDAMRESGGNGTPQAFVAKWNDKVLFEMMVSRNRSETLRTGANPLMGMG